jgi:hypothetical protein
MATPVSIAKAATKVIKDSFFILSFLLLLIVLVWVWLVVCFSSSISFLYRQGLF